MPAKAAMPPKARVLLLGHDTSLETRVARALQAEGYEIFLAASNRRALVLSRASGIDAWVLDLDFYFREIHPLTPERRVRELGCVLLIARSLEQLALASETKAEVLLLESLDATRLASLMNHLLSGQQMQAFAKRWHANDTAAVARTRFPRRLRGSTNEMRLL